MSIRFGLLQTRVARRILALFVTGAMVPVIVMAGVSYWGVAGQLRAQSEGRLKQLADNANQSLVEQLLLAQSALRRLAFLAASGTTDSTLYVDVVSPVTEAVTLTDARGRTLRLVGDPLSPPVLHPGQRSHLLTGDMVLETGGSAHELLGAMALDTTDLGRGILWARLTADSIWAPANLYTTLATRADFCVLGEEDVSLFCASGNDDVAEAFRASATEARSGVLYHEAGSRAVFIGFRRVFLKSAFLAPDWTVLVSEADQSVFEPMVGFRYTFLLSLSLGLMAVLLLANVQVRRTMNPLDALEEGTKKVAGGDLSARVAVTSDDEFGMLAESFNRMAGQLGLQFRQLQARRAIDDAVLRAVAREEVVTAVLSHFRSVIPSHRVCMVLVEGEARGSASLRQWDEMGEGKRREVALTRADIAWIRRQPHHRVLQDGERRPGFLDPDTGEDPPDVLIVLPIVVAGQVRGVLWYEPEEGGVFDAAALARAREIIDQATIALDDLRLSEELKEMTWGTLRALARAIDAKSKWTAGHSERVTELALAIGLELELGERDLDILNRGGLLHDVGKIGVPAGILDKPGFLTPEEREQVEQHPVIGGRILEPIQAFGPMLAIVTQHHEKWDGTGYPDGLKGEEIDPLARILAVADVYDAMASPRPYRNALDPETVVSEIQKDIGTHFEPRAAAAFLRLMARRGVVPRHTTEEPGG